MDEITDQFRTEDAEEFKQLQAELEIAGWFNLNPQICKTSILFSLAKNCRILQFKLRKSEKRNENIEAEKTILEGKIIFRSKKKTYSCIRIFFKVVRKKRVSK